MPARVLVLVAISLSWQLRLARAECAKPKRSDSVRIDCVDYVVPKLVVRNWSGRFWPERGRRGEPAIPSFHSPGRRRPELVTKLTIHETANGSMRGAAEHFARNRLGVHFVIDRRGRVSHHNDLTEILSHDRDNARSVGIELVNWIYVPKRQPGQTIIGRWTTNTPHHYLVPTLAQVEALHVLATWLTSRRSGLRIPRRFAGIARRGNQPWFTFSFHQPVPPDGVRAHGHLKQRFRGVVVGRSDGFFPTLYLWLRWKRSLPPARAYACARRITNDARLRSWRQWHLDMRSEPWVWKPVEVRGILGELRCSGA